jgi:sRNA-binding protein
MSEEKKAAMLAKRAATKAAKEAAAAPAPEAEEAEEVVEEVTAAAPAEETVQGYKWMGKIGKDKKEKAYERIDYAGKSYIYVFTEEADGNYLGAMVGTSTTLDMTVPDIRPEMTEE